MSDVKQVKVDNWGIYFLQRLKHFFNRTDYCDLTLQFQDNAQLKVHRLVLNACTEYFEILERTCEMYEDCLVMPDDLQADVVVPIVNFMYTGQLEFRMEALDKLYQTSQVMNMPVLSKLLEAHRASNGKGVPHRTKPAKHSEGSKHSMNISQSFSPSSAKRSYQKAFENSKFVDPKRREATKTSASKQSMTNKKTANNKDVEIIYRDKKYRDPQNKSIQNKPFREPSPIPLDPSLYNKKLILGEPRPTRYELPEELDTDNVFDSSFSNISYTSAPLMVHPETTKQYSKKKNSLFNEPTSSKKVYANSTVDIVECKKISKNDSLYDDDVSQSASYDDVYGSAFLSVKDESLKDTNQLFDQMLDNSEGPKVTIEAKDKHAGNLDHAKIISEVLKKYPHLVKSNKNIKLKILNTPAKAKKPRPTMTNQFIEVKPKQEMEPAYTYETDVLDSKEAAKLIAMGAENIKGPWICLICGTPGRALNFVSYYNFRRHLVEVHQEKPVSTICEYCGLKSHKRNYLLHHIYTKHGVPPPPHYNFPKCNMCDYIALTEGFLVKHKLSHSEERKTSRCSICHVIFISPTLLAKHMQTVHLQHKVDPKSNYMQCNYCMKVFMRDNNFFAHLKTAHKEQAIRDGIVADSDEENEKIEQINQRDLKHEIVKYELPGEHDFEDVEIEYQVQKRSNDSHITHTQGTKKPKISISNQKILNPGFSIPVSNRVQKPNVISNDNNEHLHGEKCSQIHADNVVLIDNKEYIMKDNQLIPRKSMKSNEYIISDYMEEEPEQNLQTIDPDTPTTSIEFTDIHPTEIHQTKMVPKKPANINQPIQIVVSNEEEYKALMASNHSIIFDDSDPSKTLTVLTAAENPTLNTTAIELENNQSNDMMIIQDDYPLNVSEAVSADNSKYVVVYSHAMESDNSHKQYQIITSQELGSQYVQTSAVLTQNFETVSTTTPVVSANVIDTQLEESWPQNEDNQNLVHVTSQSVIQNVNDTDQTIMTQVDITRTLSDLPEVELSKNSDIPETPETISGMPATIPALEENQFNNPADSMDIERTEIPEVTVQEQENLNPQPEESEMISQQNVCTNTVTVQEQQQVLSTPIEEQNIEEVTEESNCVPENDNTDSIEPALNIVEDVSMSEENTAVEEMTVKEVNVEPVVEAKKQIQNLTSEWSEDEYDVVLEESVEQENLQKNIAETGNTLTEEPELEESIENITQEVHKQITSLPVIDTEEDKYIENECTKDLQEPGVVIDTVHVEATQEKISSLLNDWEDNDSQEETTNENTDNSPIASEPLDTNGAEAGEISDANETSSIIPVTTDDPKKDDKIKSLVSDWDDDEEENKE